jgi:hypothetical protein
MPFGGRPPPKTVSSRSDPLDSRQWRIACEKVSYAEDSPSLYRIAELAPARRGTRNFLDLYWSNHNIFCVAEVDVTNVGSSSTSMRLVSAARPADRHDGVVHAQCRSRGRRPARPADGPNPKPNTRAEGLTCIPTIPRIRTSSALTSRRSGWEREGVVFSRNAAGAARGLHFDGILLSAKERDRW